MNEPRVMPPGVKDIPYAVFFSEIFLSDKFDLEAIFFGNFFGIIAQFISKGLGKTGVIENSDILVAQESGHPMSVT
jgi:hypothetical protein